MNAEGLSPEQTSWPTVHPPDGIGNSAHFALVVKARLRFPVRHKIVCLLTDLLAIPVRALDPATTAVAPMRVQAVAIAIVPASVFVLRFTVRLPSG
jgi:hypothetical protein